MLKTIKLRDEMMTIRKDREMAQQIKKKVKINARDHRIKKQNDDKKRWRYSTKFKKVKVNAENHGTTP